ncbi:hypothetical protein BDE02_04G128100 [Populus trichocarpa]|jgi:hypothetical protein|nr:hypothetical protein BDE02_04G040900 [Populus trichocarpa]KAI5592086.1 hypothetical protein BDE02_04G128100 [Populus trichocarpa]
MTVGLREERSGGAETAKGGLWLCVVGWKRKRRWGTVWRLSGEAAVLGQSFVFKGGSGGRLREKRKIKRWGAGRCPSCLQNRGWRREAAVGEEKISGVWAVVEGKWVLMCRTWGWLWVAAREEG